MAKQDHDQRMKLALREFAAEFVSLAAPAAWRACFAMALADWLQQEFFLDPPQGERRQIDLLARVPLTRPVNDVRQSLLHFEIESGPSLSALRRRMPEYRGVLRTRYGLPVLSLALYLDVGMEGVGWDEEREDFLGEETGRVRWRYVGLPKLDALTRVEGDNILAVALSVLMSVAEERKPWLKARAMQRIAEADLTPARRFLLMEIVEAYSPLHGPHLDEFQHLLLTEDFKMARELGKTSRELGIEEGEEKGRRAVIREQLEAKFGTLSATARQRLEGLSLERLREITPTIWAVKSLAELGLEDAPT